MLVSPRRATWRALWTLFGTYLLVAWLLASAAYAGWLLHRRLRPPATSAPRPHA